MSKTPVDQVTSWSNNQLIKRPIDQAINWSSNQLTMINWSTMIRWVSASTLHWRQCTSLNGILASESAQGPLEHLRRVRWDDGFDTRTIETSWIQDRSVDQSDGVARTSVGRWRRVLQFEHDDYIAGGCWANHSGRNVERHLWTLRWPVSTNVETVDQRLTLEHIIDRTWHFIIIHSNVRSIMRFIRRITFLVFSSILIGCIILLPPEIVFL